MKVKHNGAWLPYFLLMGVLSIVLSGCVPLVVVGVAGAAAGTTVVVKDRRPLGVQTTDEENEWKAAARIKELFGDVGHVNFVSYNRKILITGEIAHDIHADMKREILHALPTVSEVRDETQVMAPSSFSDRSRDSLITSKVKSRLAETKGVSANNVKLITERGTVYLMGLVTAVEADLAVQAARTTSDVQKVVGYFEVKSEEEINMIK